MGVNGDRVTRVCLGEGIISNKYKNQKIENSKTQNFEGSISRLFLDTQNGLIKPHSGLPRWVIWSI